MDYAMWIQCKKKKLQGTYMPIVVTSVLNEPLIGSVECIIDRHLNVNVGLFLLLHEFPCANPVA